MTSDEARALHNEDEVTLRRTGQVLTVLSVREDEGAVWLDCVDHYNAPVTARHDEVV